MTHVVLEVEQLSDKERVERHEDSWFKPVNDENDG